MKEDNVFSLFVCPHGEGVPMVSGPRSFPEGRGTPGLWSRVPYLVFGPMSFPGGEGYPLPQAGQVGYTSPLPWPGQDKVVTNAVTEEDSLVVE